MCLCVYVWECVVITFKMHCIFVVVVGISDKYFLQLEQKVLGWGVHTC